MDYSGEESDIVRLAQQGCQDSLNHLTKMVQPKLLAYFLRLVMGRDLVDDLIQETSLEMVRSLNKLRNPESFWPWLYRIALGKAHQHFHAQQTERAYLFNQNNHSPERHSDATTAVMRKELAEVVSEALSELSLHNRNVLILRCFNGLSFAEIAETIDCGESKARVLFFRSKQLLKKNLSRKGIGKGALLTALSTFGAMTESTQAASMSVPLTAASLKAGSVASVIGTVSLNIVSTIIAIITASVFIVGSIMLTGDTDSKMVSAFDTPPRAAVKSFHFVAQSWDGTSNMPNSNLARGRSLSKGAYEQWFFFPEGVEGPMFFMMQRWDPRQTVRLCSWLQNGSGNYYYYSGKNTIYQYNAPLPLGNLQTRRLPTDSAEFTEFLDKVENNTTGLNYQRDPKTGLLTGALDNRFYNAQDFHTAITYNNLSEASFGTFLYKWPDDAPVVDERDEMHRRGWTCFEITGNINGQEVHGVGRVPFIYDKLVTYPPAMSLNIGNKLNMISITDTPSGAKLFSNAEPVGIYPGGTFFKGMLRPWRGMHTLDLIRREAAEKKICFKMKNLGTRWEPDEKVELTLLAPDSENQIKIVYLIDMSRNIIEKIEFWSGGIQCGSLVFKFPDNFKELEASLAEQLAGSASKYARQRQATGLLWLFNLANGTLTK